MRNVASPHGRRWLGVENRCVVPFTSFSENEALPDGTRPGDLVRLERNPPTRLLLRDLDPRDLVRKVKNG